MLKNFRSLTSLRNYFYIEIFLTKELVHASSIRSTTVRLHKANNQYGGGILERHCCVQGEHVYKDAWDAAVGEVLIYEQELTTLQEHSKFTSISYRNYFAGLIIQCRKYFTVSIICCTNFREIYFRSLGRLRKYVDNENFQIYSIC